MDITAKYRTKHPPKEHEEAVRMLLKSAVRSKRQADQLAEASSSEASCPMVSASASDSTSSSSGIDQDNYYREPIPSRTIAVQCDLKASSVAPRQLSKLAASKQVEPEMQVSSISSTRYGFYNFTPESLEVRRRQQQMQRAVSNRDLAPTSGPTVEAPTSMSELSSEEESGVMRTSLPTNERPMAPRTTSVGRVSGDSYERQAPGSSATIARSNGLMSSQYYDSQLYRRGPTIATRAMSQRSLTRPTMSLARPRRRASGYQMEDEDASSMARATAPTGQPSRPMMPRSTNIGLVSADFYGRHLPGSSATISRSNGLMTPQYLDSRLQRRGPTIGGRAMSQQSLTRPTMSLARSRRRAVGSGGSQSGSDLGGSSMSLVSRLQGRYENAHTRSPVVMYIPQAPTRAESIGRPSVVSGSHLRKSSRSRQYKSMSGSQDSFGGLRRSSSRNGSDSESSSMLRTLVKPRASRLQASKRASRLQQYQSMAGHYDENEDIDNLGQLASEVDSFKFRRRYSVPKDAKINWFAKLKQRVSSVAK